MLLQDAAALFVALALSVVHLCTFNQCTAGNIDAVKILIATMRLNGKVFTPPELYVTETFQRMLFEKKQCVLYTKKDLSVYSACVLRHLEAVQLPFLSVYEINAECVDGITVGYLFEIFSKRISSSYNYFAVTSLKKDELSLSALKKADSCLDLRFKIKGMKLYALDATGVLVTCGFNEDLKETLEF